MNKNFLDELIKEYDNSRMATLARYYPIEAPEIDLKILMSFKAFKEELDKQAMEDKWKTL